LIPYGKSYILLTEKLEEAKQMTIFKEADLETALPKVKKKVKSLVKKGYDKAKGTVTPKWIVSQIAKKSWLGKVWKKVPKKQQQQITKSISKVYNKAKSKISKLDKNKLFLYGTTGPVIGGSGYRMYKERKNKAKNKTQSMKHGGKVRSYNFIN
jgi:hypothetical protein